MAETDDRQITPDQVKALKECIEEIRAQHQGYGNIRIVMHAGRIVGIYTETARWLRQKERDDAC